MSSYEAGITTSRFAPIGGRQTMCQDVKDTMGEINNMMTINVAKKHVASDVGAPYQNAALRGNIDVVVYGHILYIRWKSKFRTYYATRTIVPTNRQKMRLGGRHTVSIAYHGTQPTREEVVAFL